MKYLEAILFAAYLIAFFCLTSSQDNNAYAYLDPGLGSFIHQILLASLLGVLYAIKIYWKKLTQFFAKLTRRKQKAADE